MIKEDNLILSIAGHDPTGGAGIQVDAQIANFHGKHCLSILTCETVQNLNSFEKLIPQEETLEVTRQKGALFIGIPKETYFQEKRICLTPDAVAAVVATN